MTRKDTILIAVVINAGLLAILFATAIIYDDTNKEGNSIEISSSLSEIKPLKEEQPPSLIAVSSGDEVDNVLKHYHRPTQASHPLLIETSTENYVPEPLTVQAYRQEESKEESFFQCLEITVKKGDSLDKIARGNHTTVSAIKKFNHLQNENLSIGQVLKIPMKKELSSPLSLVNPSLVSSSSISLPVLKQEVDLSLPTYYSVKSGDSPWKIAKQFNVKYEEILKLNQLDEEKARNLKIGDRIRVK